MRKMRHIRAKLLAVVVMALFIIIPIDAEAEDVYKLQQITTCGDELTAYITGTEKPDRIEYQIAMTACDDVAFGTVDDMGETIHTVILMDNSLSITEENRKKAMDFLREYVQMKDEKEEISLAVFGEDVKFLAEKCADSGTLLTAIDTIEFNNQDTYLTDILYHLLDEVRNDTGFTRFMILSDGVDNKAIGITKDELTDKLKDNPHPVDTLGHVYKENEDELENMFALSRLTYGRYFLLDDIEESAELVSKLKSDSGLFCVKAKAPENLCDGSVKSTLFTISVGNEKYEVTAEATMPFAVKAKEEPQPEPVVEEEREETAETAEAAQETEAVRQPDGHQDSGHIIMKTIAAAGIAAAGIILCFALRKKDKKSAKKERKKSKEIPVPAAAPVAGAQPADMGGTVLLDGRYLLVLRDQKNHDRIFKYPLDSKVIVGRNADKVNIAVDYSKTVSGQHCEFYVRGNRFFVRDLQSANHTYLNNAMIHGETELASGSTIRMGEVVFYVEFVPI